MRMVKEVDSPALKVCLDAPIMDDKSMENMRKAAKAVGDLQVLSHFGGEWIRNSDGKLVDIHEKDADGNVWRRILRLYGANGTILPSNQEYMRRITPKVSPSGLSTILES